MISLSRIRPGLYTAEGYVIEHRPDIDGFWYVTAPDASYPDDCYPTLREAREALSILVDAARPVR